MRRDVEAVLFASDQPLSLVRLAAIFPEVDRAALRAAIEELRAEYDRAERAFTIVEFGGGYSVCTRPEHAAVVRRLYRGRTKVRLSRAALECLAIAAYKQPVTRLEIEEIRGVSVVGVLGTLLERDLVTIVGRAQGLGHPLLYGTTRSFLDYLGLKALEELPQLAELEDLLARREELKQLAARYGTELGDEELDEFAAADGAQEATAPEAEPMGSPTAEPPDAGGREAPDALVVPDPSDASDAPAAARAQQAAAGGAD
jgi:segregation and condensation protein B